LKVRETTIGFVDEELEVVENSLDVEVLRVRVALRINQLEKVNVLDHGLNNGKYDVLVVLNEWVLLLKSLEQRIEGGIRV
jgi:hypothetical protein